MGSAPSQEERPPSMGQPAGVGGGKDKGGKALPAEAAHKASGAPTLASEAGGGSTKTTGRVGPSLIAKRPQPEKSLLKERLRWRKDPTEVATVSISLAGFSKTQVNICAGQFVVFVWEASEGSGPGYNVTQVVHDGDQFRPVPGGIHSGALSVKGSFEYQFSQPGEYKFVSAGIRCTPLTVAVGDRREIFAKLEDDGFAPRVLHLEVGESVKWSWTHCTVPHIVQQATYCAAHGGLKKLGTEKGEIATLTGSYVHSFKHPGLFYFMASGNTPAEYHLCIVHVHDCYGEHRVEITDRSFEPPILVVNAGDRVWFQWSKATCQKKHNPYEVVLPARGARREESFKLKKQGFRWPQPSRSGLMAHDFLEPGVYHYSDFNHQEAAAYVGTVIVKVKPQEHRIQLTADGFTPDLLQLAVNERVWWTWDPKEMAPAFNIAEAGSTLAGGESLSSGEGCEEGQCQPLDDASLEAFASIGALTVTPSHASVQHFKLNNAPNSVASSTLIAVPGLRNHTITITETGFEPKKLSVSSGDLVWWVWQRPDRLHNVIQVSPEGRPLDDGFQSGAMTDPPCAFMHRFERPGLYHFASEGLQGVVGTVVCRSACRVHQVQAGSSGLSPDPVVATVNDLVAWVFRGLRTHDVVNIAAMGDLMDAQHRSQGLTPRRCMERAFTEVGTFNFTSRAFLQLGANKEAPMDETRISSVIVNEPQDHTVVRLSAAAGFFPAAVTVVQGDSVLWDWAEAPETEEHNIVNVNPPTSAAPLSTVNGDLSFNSGRVSRRGSFLYTFTRPGMFCVASVGAPGRSGSVLVLPEPDRTPVPKIVSFHEGGTVAVGTVVRLECRDPKAVILYTMDGTPPVMHRPGVKVYQTWEPLKLRKPGIVFIRAIAVAPNRQPSDIFTSRRFWVVDPGDGAAEAVESEAEAEEVPVAEAVNQMESGPMSESWKWFNCVPAVKLLHIVDGTVEVFWQPLADGLTEMLAGYRLLLNGISYGGVLLPSSSCLQASGLAAGRVYSIWVEAVPRDGAAYQPHKSNKLTFECPQATSVNGPLVSLELSSKPSTITLVWGALTASDYSLRGYKVTLNGRQCGKLVTPEAGNKRCKVVIEGCTLNADYSIIVSAVRVEPTGEMSELPSNKLQFRLPLDIDSVVPPDGARLLESEELSEFAFVSEGVGYHRLPAEQLEAVQMADRRAAEKEKAARLAEVDGGGGSSDSSSSSSPRSSRKSSIAEEDDLKENIADSPLKPLPALEREVRQEAHEEDELESESDEDTRQQQPPRSHIEEVPLMEDAEFNKRELPPHARFSSSSGSGSGSSSDSEPAAPPPKTLSRDLEAAKKDKKSRIAAPALSPSPPPLPAAAVLVSQHNGPPQQQQQQQQQQVKQSNRKDTDTVVELADPEPAKENHAVAGAAGAAAAAAAVAAGAAAMPAEETASGLPVPAVQVLPDADHPDRVRVAWEFSRPLEHQFRHELSTVSISGRAFSSRVNSDMSFDSEADGIVHTWNCTGGERDCLCRGLAIGCDYRISVSATFYQLDSSGVGRAELVSKSAVCDFTTAGPPDPPLLSVQSVDVNQVVVAWRPGRAYGGEDLVGYRLLIDGEPQGGQLPAQTSQTTLEPLQPGRTVAVSVVAVAGRSQRASQPSNSVRISCPRRPEPPQLSEQPASAEGAVIVSWPGEAAAGPQEEDVSKYRVFVDEKWHGELKASPGRRTYTYYLSDLRPGVVYDVQVKAIAGHKNVDPDADHVFCLCESELSAPLSVSCSAPPISPALRVESMTEEGLEVSWSVPQQFGEAQISGYQMLRDGEPYGSVLPADATSFRLRDLTLGQRLTLQLVALTAHPVGRGEEPAEGAVEHQQFNRCTPGPALVVNYTGLVLAPARVWCDDVTGHSATVAWTRSSAGKLHFIQPTHYQVTWWPGSSPDREVNSASTPEDFALLEGLAPATAYTVVVEARCEQRQEAGGTVIVSSRPQRLTLRTAEPPLPPSNLGVAATTCCSLLVAWDPPVERGSEVIGIRVECAPAAGAGVNSGDLQVLELMPDATRALIENLKERTDYSVRVCAVTEEALQSLPPRHPARLARKLPADLAELSGLVDVAWMPSAHLVATTSGTLAPARIRLACLTDQTIKLRWQPPSVTGSNRLRGQVVRWTEVPDAAKTTARSANWDGPSAADYVSLDPKDAKVSLEGLRPGTKYRVVVEAVVSVKTALDPQSDGATAEEEQRNRRTAHVSSDPVFVRTRCHVTKPRLMVAAVRPDSILLHWERPYAMVAVRPEQAGERRYVRCHIEGYRLEINGKPYVSLRPDSQTCRLVKCRPGKLYSIVLVAVSQTDAAKKEARRMRKSRGYEKDQQQQQQICLYPDEPDETFSEPVEVRVPGGQLAAIRELSAEFHLPDSGSGDGSGGGVGGGVGEVRLRWSLDDEFQGQVKQFNVTWSTDRDTARAQRRVLDASATSAALECGERGCVVTARLECVLTRETREPIVQQVQLTTPGPPATPEIFLDALSDREILIEWSEPALTGGVGVAGYQLLVNGKNAGEPLEAAHRRAVIPCRPNRHYRVQLVALSAHRDFPDSPASSPLFISTHPNMPAVSDALPADFLIDGGAEEATNGDQSEIPLSVSARTDTTLTVEWMAYQPADGVHSFALQWSSAAQPAERTETLAHQERSCLLQNLLPGTVYSVRLSALDSNRAVVEKSRALRVQTCAPIDTPVLSLRACNFSYIAVQWTAPKHYGDAPVAGYKVFINGVVEETLGAGETSFTYCKGRWCQDYSFQVQAISSNPRFNSKPSDSLLVTWPGCLPGELRPLAATVSGAARVGWPAPFLTEGVKLKQFRLICKLADTGQVVRVVGPLHPETREAEVTGLRSGSYHLQLEVQLHGTQMAVLSAALTVQPTLTPDPPTVSVVLVGLEQRRQLEAAVCRLVNRRDRHVRLIHNIHMLPTKTLEETQLLARYTEAYNQIMDSLEDCFKSLETYTGEFVLQVSWTCPQSNKEVPLSGYRVLVDGRQYGSALHQGMSSVRIKLSTDKPSHSVSMVALCESQGTQSAESNAVEVLTDPFLPMAFYCIHEVHCGEKWPRKGCCLYQETLVVERRNFLNYYNPGFLNQFVPAPAAHVQLLPGGERQRLFPPGGPKSVTLLCFWTRWCVASVRYMKFFVRLAAGLRKQFDFVAIATQRFDNAHERSALQHCIKELALETDGLAHYYAVDRVKGSNDEPMSTAEAYHIVGVPFFVAVHSEGYIAWRGRHCAPDYNSFEDEMSQVLRAVKDKTRLDDQLSVDGGGQQTVDHSHARHAFEETSLVLHPANSFVSMGGATGSKKPAPKQSPAKLSISTRPYSGRPSSASASGADGGGGGAGGGAGSQQLRKRRSGSAAKRD